MLCIAKITLSSLDCSDLERSRQTTPLPFDVHWNSWGINVFSATFEYFRHGQEDPCTSILWRISRAPSGTSASLGDSQLSWRRCQCRFSKWDSVFKNGTAKPVASSESKQFSFWSNSPKSELWTCHNCCPLGVLFKHVPVAELRNGLRAKNPRRSFVYLAGDVEMLVITSQWKWMEMMVRTRRGIPSEAELFRWVKY